MTVKFTIATVL